MDLHTLIETHGKGRTSEQLGLASGISKTVMHALRSEPADPRALKAFPRPEVIRGLAIALNVTPQEIVNAAAESLGLIDPAEEAPRHLIRRLTNAEPHEVITAVHQLQEQVYYWQNHAATYKQYRQHFTRLQPIAQQRPWLIAGTQHQANHMQENEATA